MQLTAPFFEVDAEGEPIKSFVDAFAAKFNDAPDVWSAHGYDAMMVLVEAIPSPFRTASDFRRGMKGIEDYPGVAGFVRFDERGDVSKFPRVYQVTKDGLRRLRGRHQGPAGSDQRADPQAEGRAPTPRDAEQLTAGGSTAVDMLRLNQSAQADPA